MSPLRSLIAVALMAMGTLLSINCYNQPISCYSSCIHRSSYDHAAGIGGLFAHRQSNAHPVNNHGFCGLCSNPSARDIILQSIDLEDDWTLTVMHSRSDAKACPSADNSAYHHSEQVAASNLPRYLLTSALLL
jgi:hypothetical protein